MYVICALQERQWPTDPYKESNVDFIVPLRSFNETTDTVNSYMYIQES